MTGSRTYGYYLEKGMPKRVPEVVVECAFNFIIEGFRFAEVEN
jgi:hypothetical protein